MKRKTSFLGLALVLLLGCNTPNSTLPISQENHAEEVEAWVQTRMKNLKAEDGWLNLIGLFWLEEGDQGFGSGKDNALSVEDPDFPEALGNFVLINKQLFFIPLIEGIFFGEKPLNEETLIYDAAATEGKDFSYKNFRWSIIKRGDAIGLRLRNLDSPALSTFNGIDRFPVDLKWRLSARFVPYEPIKLISITNVLGQTSPTHSTGVVEFEIEGKTFQLDALEEGDQLFLIFADGTSGGETYGGGRYIYVDKADNKGNIILDFNKAYNPPCVFNEHATCPLPPRQNILKTEIKAGEKNYSH